MSRSIGSTRWRLTLVLAGVVVVAGLAVGVLIAHHVSSPRRKSSGGMTAGLAGPANLETAETAAKTYYAANHDSFIGLASSWSELPTGLSGVAGTNPSMNIHTVSINVESSTSVVITGYWTEYTDCLGVLIIEKALRQPYYRSYAATSRSATFYFVGASSRPSACAASTVNPAPAKGGVAGLTSAGFSALDRPGL